MNAFLLPQQRCVCMSCMCVRVCVCMCVYIYIYIMYICMYESACLMCVYHHTCYIWCMPWAQFTGVSRGIYMHVNASMQALYTYTHADHYRKRGQERIRLTYTHTYKHAYIHADHYGKRGQERIRFCSFQAPKQTYIGWKVCVCMYMCHWLEGMSVHVYV